jgi:hypothetical protein
MANFHLFAFLHKFMDVITFNCISLFFYIKLPCIFVIATIISSYE